MDVADIQMISMRTLTEIKSFKTSMLELFFCCSFHTTKLKAPDQLNNMSKMCFGIDNIDFIWVTKLVESDCLKHISQWKFVSSFQQYDKCQERANTLNWLTFFWNGKSGHCSVFLIVLSLLPNFCVCVSVKSDWIEQIIWLSCLESNSNSSGSSSSSYNCYILLSMVILNLCPWLSASEMDIFELIVRVVHPV